MEGLKYSYSMKGHMDPDYGGKVEGLKYSYSMKGHMDTDYGKGNGWVPATLLGLGVLKWFFFYEGEHKGWLALFWLGLGICGWPSGWVWLNPPTPGPKPRGPQRGKWEGARSSRKALVKSLFQMPFRSCSIV